MSRKPKEKDVCCVCGGAFSARFDGKPYCNKHWLRMYNNGTIVPKQRARTSTYEISGDKLIIRTSRGATIIADAAEYDLLSKHSWCISQGYAIANINGKLTKMEHLILGHTPSKSKVIDHINGTRTDNRRVNLRVATQADNARNTSKPKNGRNPYIGVRLTPFGKYNVRITRDRKEIYIGNFATLEEAVSARCKAEDKYFGEFAPHKRMDVSIWEAE